jgi:hypothetical protein
MPILSWRPALPVCKQGVVLPLELEHLGHRSVELNKAADAR